MTLTVLEPHTNLEMQIYYFLVKFPVYDRLLKEFSSDTPHSEIFPLGQPFKSLYAINSLREYLTSQSQKVSVANYFETRILFNFPKGSVNETALTRAISLIISAISDKDVLDHCTSDDLRDCLALHLIDCFVQLLKGKRRPQHMA